LCRDFTKLSYIGTFRKIGNPSFHHLVSELGLPSGSPLPFFLSSSYSPLKSQKKRLCSRLGFHRPKAVFSLLHDSLSESVVLSLCPSLCFCCWFRLCFGSVV
jgi:hypothetical protein